VSWKAGRQDSRGRGHRGDEQTRVLRLSVLTLEAGGGGLFCMVLGRVGGRELRVGKVLVMETSGYVWLGTYCTVRMLFLRSKYLCLGACVQEEEKKR